MDKKKLYLLTNDDFSLPFFVDEKRGLSTTPANDIPLLTWPDGRWCLQANVYMLELYRRGLSRKNRGGTLLSYATNISHLIRHCYDKRVDFINLTDSDFSNFIKSLSEEADTKNPDLNARDANTVIAIGRNCLDFMASIGRFYNDDGFIGKSGRIVISEKEVTIKLSGRSKGRDKLVRQYIHHHSFPTPDPKNKRLPISTKSITKLYDSVEAVSRTIFQRKRRYVMLKLLEITGGRRSEVAALTVASVRKAATMKEPRLKLLTAKRRGGKETFRYIPIFSHDLEFLLDFIDINRRRIIRKTCGANNDDGFVFVSETTGHKLRPNTITQEIHALAKEAELDEQTCPHMFRHSFITNLFVALIEQHRFENADSFREALLDVEAFKQEVLEWTGHTDTRSLDTYINLAFAKYANFQKTLNAVSFGRLIESMRSSIHTISLEIQAGMSTDSAIQKLLSLTESAESDFTRIQNHAIS